MEEKSWGHTQTHTSHTHLPDPRVCAEGPLTCIWICVHVRCVCVLVNATCIQSDAVPPPAGKGLHVWQRLHQLIDVSLTDEWVGGRMFGVCGKQVPLSGSFSESMPPLRVIGHFPLPLCQSNAASLIPSSSLLSSRCNSPLSLCCSPLTS